MPMEAFSVRSLTATTIPHSLSRRGVSEKASGHVNFSKYSDFIRYPSTSRALKQNFRSTRAQASGSSKSSTGTAEGVPEKTDSKDDNLVFVAGATGKVGSRTVRELIKLGFRVRAGVRSAQRARALVQSVENLKLDATSASGGSQAVEKLEIVECDLEKPDQIGPALGNASKLICTIGASEKEVFDITGPYRIDYQATKNLIDAATVAKVNHFILVTSLGTNKVGFPAAILNLFWGVLIWKRKAEEALLASGLPYTIVRPGGMERPTDAYKETHNITLSTEDTLFGGQVSNLQVAELMAVMAKNFDRSCCKIVEVIAETTAPLTPMEELLAKIPSQRPCASSTKEPDVAVVSDPVPSVNVVAEEPSIATQKETAQPKPPEKQPLSPYTAYDDLKPPSSPSPVQPGGTKPIKISDTASQPSASASDDPVSSANVVAAESGIATQKESAQPKAVGKQPLSPYTAYDDLKPPSSPSPAQPGGLKQIKISDTVPQPSASASDAPSSVPGIDGISQTSLSKGKTSLSPYSAYEDLKPPTSPSPTPSSSSDKPLTSSTVVESASPPAEDKVAEKYPSPDSDSSNSPYPVYPDFKPPTTPSPNAPTTSPPISAADTVPETIESVPSNGPAQLSVADEPKQGQHLPEPKSRPLSPYTMYEDLKPPASPTPSFRKS